MTDDTVIATDLASRSTDRVELIGNLENICKICFEFESEKQQLISPCMCTGSMRYVHEECLKTWILARYIDISKSVCEVCKYSIKMRLVVKQQCKLKRKEKCSTCRIAHYIILCGLLIGLSIAVSILFTSLGSGSKSKNDGILIGLIVTFFMILLLCLSLVTSIIADLSCIQRLTDWRILEANSLPITKNRRTNKVHAYNSSAESQDSLNRPQQLLLLPSMTQLSGFSTEVPRISPNMRRIATTNEAIQVFALSSSEFDHQQR